jgi:hypothetical protein
MGGGVSIKKFVFIVFDFDTFSAIVATTKGREYHLRDDRDIL